VKTKEQRAAEKAARENAAAKSITLEEFIESERLKLTGTLTPVTPETFAKWKKERLDKKAAEEQLRKAKENTGRALFESGMYKEEDSEDEGDSAWNLEKLRKETEALRIKREEERLARQYGLIPEGTTDDGETNEKEKEPEGDEKGADEADKAPNT